VLLFTVFSSFLMAQDNKWYSGRLDASNCVRIYSGVLNSHDGGEQLIMENTCNYKIDVAWCNVGVGKNQAGCGTGPKYYRQNRSLEPGAKYTNRFSLILGKRQHFAACPFYKGGSFGYYGGIKSFSGDGSFGCYPPK
jgi:hypothetical protein